MCGSGSAASTVGPITQHGRVCPVTGKADLVLSHVVVQLGPRLRLNWTETSRIQNKTNQSGELPASDMLISITPEITFQPTTTEETQKEREVLSVTISLL